MVPVLVSTVHPGAPRAALAAPYFRCHHQTVTAPGHHQTVTVPDAGIHKQISDLSAPDVVETNLIEGVQVLLPLRRADFKSSCCAPSPHCAPRCDYFARHPPVPLPQRYVLLGSDSLLFPHFVCGGHSAARGTRWCPPPRVVSQATCLCSCCALRVALLVLCSPGADQLFWAIP